MGKPKHRKDEKTKRDRDREKERKRERERERTKGWEKSRGGGRERGRKRKRTWEVAGRENACLGKARIHSVQRIMRWIFEFILVHVTMPGTSGVYTWIPRQRASSPRAVGASANYVAFRVVYAGGAREKRRNFRCLHRQVEAGTRFNRW